MKFKLYIKFKLYNQANMVRAACINWQGRDIYARPHTPDVAVAYSCFNGEFSTAIEAAKPLRYGLIVDAGGYIGTAAIAFAEAFPDAKIVSLEPSPENFELLYQNTRAYPNISALSKALGSVPGVTSLIDPGEREWGYTTVSSRTHKGASEPAKVTVTTIAELMAQFRKSGIDLLKLDIEGSERELFEGGPPPWMGSVRVICAEMHDWLLPGCTAAFESATQGRKKLEKDGEKIVSVLG